MKAYSLACSLTLAALSVFPAAGQNTNAQKTPSSKTWTVPRTPDGKPDLQGVWTNVTITPLERPSELGGKQFFTKEEAARYEKDTLERTNADRRDGGAEADVGRI